MIIVYLNLHVFTTDLSSNLPVPLNDTFALHLNRSGIFGLFAMIIFHLIATL